MSTQPDTPERSRTVLTDIDIPFGRLVVFFIKAGLASIPAAIILWVILMIVIGLLGALLGFGFNWRMHSTVL
jgi:hypothetical protein